MAEWFLSLRTDGDRRRFYRGIERINMMRCFSVKTAAFEAFYLAIAAGLAH